MDDEMKRRLELCARQHRRHQSAIVIAALERYFAAMDSGDSPLGVRSTSPLRYSPIVADPSINGGYGLVGFPSEAG